MDRRHFLKTALAAGSAAIVPALPGDAFAQTMPSASEIIRKLENDPRGRRMDNIRRVSPHVFKKSPQLRRIAPSIDIQAINFAFGSADIPANQRWKIEQIAIAINRILRRNPREVFLIEGHTDAVGSRASNQVLSERRAGASRQMPA